MFHARLRSARPSWAIAQVHQAGPPTIAESNQTSTRISNYFITNLLPQTRFFYHSFSPKKRVAGQLDIKLARPP